MRRALVTALLAGFVLSSAGCPDQLVLYLTAGVLRLNVSTDGKGEQVIEETRTGAAVYNTQQPVTHAVPSNRAAGPSSGPVSASLSGTVFALTEPGGLLQLDLQPQVAQVVVRSLATGHRLRAGVASPGNQFLYLASSGPQSGTTLTPSVLIVNGGTFQTAGSIALQSNLISRAMAITPDGKYLYVAGNLAAQVFTDPSAVVCQVIDTGSRTVVKTLTFPGSRPRPEIVMSPDGGRVYITAPEGVAVIDVLTQTHSHTITDPGLVSSGSPAHIAIHPDGATLYLAPVDGPAAPRRSGIAVMDLATSTRVQHIPLAELQTMAMVVTADGAHLVVDHIVTNPATGLNDFPALEFFSLPSGALATSKPWTGSRDTPLTVHSLIAMPPREP
jgi:DNA-binding beta-propeller fold protein YncE